MSNSVDESKRPLWLEANWFARKLGLDKQEFFVLNLTDEQRQFHVEEYKLMKAEVGAMMTRIETLMRLALITAAAVFSWLLAQGFGTTSSGGWCLKLPHELLRWGWWIPTWFSVVAGVSAFVAYARGQQMAAYISRVLEARLTAPKLGWESVLAPSAPLMFRAGALYWALLVGGTAIAASQASTFSAQLKDQACRAPGPTPAAVTPQATK